MRILLIEPDAVIARSLSRYLATWGYSVSTAGDGIAGQGRALCEPIDLVLLERMPRYDGLNVLSEIHHAKPQLPIIVLAAHPDPDDCVACLDCGAVDYLTAPFSFDELAARVRAHLRTSRHAEPTRLCVGDVELDRVSRRVTRGRAKIQLSPRESDLLAFLMHNPGLVLSRSRLHRAVWGYDFDPGTNTVEVYVSSLRRKLGPPAPIKTVRGKGYRLIEREQTDVQKQT